MTTCPATTSSPCPSLELAHLPFAVAFAAGDGADRAFLAALLPGALGRCRAKLTARHAALGEIPRRREHVAHARGAIRPGDGLARLGELQRVAHAGAVALVDRLADLVADDRAEHGADHDGDRAILALADARADHAARHAAEHRADLGGVAGPFQDSVVLFPLAPGVARVARVVLLAPAVRLGVRRGLRGCGQGNERDADGEGEGSRDLLHGNPFLLCCSAPCSARPLWRTRSTLSVKCFVCSRCSPHAGRACGGAVRCLPSWASRSESAWATACTS